MFLCGAFKTNRSKNKAVNSDVTKDKTGAWHSVMDGGREGEVLRWSPQLCLAAKHLLHFCN